MSKLIKKEGETWLMFVDTNILLDFYRLGGESAKRQLSALETNKAQLITTDQLRMEYLKNRQRVIIDNFKTFKDVKVPNAPPILIDYQPYRMMKKDGKKITTNFKRVKEKIQKVLKNPGQNDPVYSALNRIFNEADSLHLSRESDVRYEIRTLALKRFGLGYPPRKKNDNSIGDAINWEWIVRCAKENSANHHIVIVSRDADFGVTFERETFLNDWLEKEFKERVSRKRKIVLTTKLTSALPLINFTPTAAEISEEEQLIAESEEPEA